MGTDGAMVFEPAVIKVSVGDTIHFKATDAAHNSFRWRNDSSRCSIMGKSIKSGF